MSKDWTDKELLAASAAMQASGNMSYEEFAAEKEAQDIVAEYAKVQEDTEVICPRCGRPTLKHPLTTNALSRHAELFVCDECGTDEAIRDFARVVLPFGEWALVKMKRLGRDARL